MENPPRPDEILDPMEASTVEEYLGGAMDKAIARKERAEDFKKKQALEKKSAKPAKPEPVPVEEIKPTLSTVTGNLQLSVMEPATVEEYLGGAMDKAIARKERAGDFIEKQKAKKQEDKRRQTPTVVSEKFPRSTIETASPTVQASAVESKKSTVTPPPENIPQITNTEGASAKPVVEENEIEGDFEVNEKGEIVEKKQPSSIQEFYRNQGEHLKEIVVSGTINFLELYKALEDFGSVVDRDLGRAKEIPSESVIGAIDELRGMDTEGRQRSLSTITSALGIRKKVSELMVSEPPVLPKSVPAPIVSAPKVESVPVAGTVPELIPVPPVTKLVETVVPVEVVPAVVVENKPEAGDTLDLINVDGRPQTGEVLKSLIFADDSKIDEEAEALKNKIIVEKIPVKKGFLAKLRAFFDGR